MNASHQWFFKLVENSGKSPTEQLLAVFGVVENLLQAPDIRERLQREFPGETHCLFEAREFNAFLARLAETAGMAAPSAVAQQLGILLQGAIAEELRNPGIGALGEAGKVAQVVVYKSKKKPFIDFMPKLAWASAGGMAALLLVVSAGWPLARTVVLPEHQVIRVALHESRAAQPGVSPDEIDAALMLHEKIEQGICRAPHLLVLPPGQVTAYMNVVEARKPDDPVADGRNLREFLAWYDKIKSTECYDRPLNGHTAVTWSRS